mmetsp:Transcript_71967/g.131792  ORF Transcript_71967/g.131792 Transcript_71967/m.131792 type:complete len:166 (-) Transcript_71967:358-855(-)
MSGVATSLQVKASGIKKPQSDSENPTAGKQCHRAAIRLEANPKRRNLRTHDASHSSFSSTSEVGVAQSASFLQPPAHQFFRELFDQVEVAAGSPSSFQEGGLTKKRPNSVQEEGLTGKERCLPERRSHKIQHLLAPLLLLLFLLFLFLLLVLLRLLPPSPPSSAH